MNGLRSTPWRLVLPAVALGLFAVVLLRTAWIGDDAYITLRTVDNFVHGHGLRWNVAERVQTYTHPLWMFAMTAVYSVTRDPLWTVFPLSYLCSMGAVLLMLLQAKDRVLAAAVVVWLVGSRAFMDWSTSGLENPLTHLLLAGIAWAVFRLEQTGEGRFARWALLGCGLLLTNRLDMGALLLPVVLWVWSVRWRAVGPWRSLGEQLLAFAPLIAWLLFATVYYGTPLPNTAYAKASTGIPQGALLAQGFRYLGWVMQFDPVTAVGVLLALVFGWRKGAAAAWLLGVLLYLLYILKVGGDFMGSRFAAAPFWVAALVLIHGEVRLPRLDRARGWVLAGVGIGVSLFASVVPWQTGADFGPVPGIDDTRAWIQDERRNYYPEGGLLADALQRPKAGALGDTQLAAPMFDTRPGVFAMNWIGVMGFLAGPKAHIIDDWLCDPVLVRLPAWEQQDFRIGHFGRHMPTGYLETVRAGFATSERSWRGPILVEPAGLRPWVQDVRAMVAAPVFDGDRWAAIWRLWSGAHQEAVDAYGRGGYRNPQRFWWSPQERLLPTGPSGAEPLADASAAALKTPWFLGDAPMMRLGGEGLRLGVPRRAKAVRLALGQGVGPAPGQGYGVGGQLPPDYTLMFFLGEQVLATVPVEVPDSPTGELKVVDVPVTEAVRSQGFDALWIKPTEPRRYARLGWAQLIGEGE